MRIENLRIGTNLVLSWLIPCTPNTFSELYLTESLHKTPREGQQHQPCSGSAVRNILGWCFICIFVAYANVCFIYLGRGRWVLMSASIKPQKTPPKQQKLIRNHPTLYHSHSCATLCVNPSPKLSIFLGQRALWGTGREWIRKVPALRFCLFPNAALGREQNCRAKTSSKGVVNIGGRNILTIQHFLPQLCPGKWRTGFSVAISMRLSDVLGYFRSQVLVPVWTQLLSWGTPKSSQMTAMLPYFGALFQQLLEKSEPNRSKLNFLSTTQSWDTETALCRRNKADITQKTAGEISSMNSAHVMGGKI